MDMAKTLNSCEGVLERTGEAQYINESSQRCGNTV